MQEYLYSQARGGGVSHEQYLSEPVSVVAWQVGIHGLFEEMKNRREGG